jgi:hypothetical protein
MRKLGEMTELLQRTVAPGMKLNTARKLGLKKIKVLDHLWHLSNNTVYAENNALDLLRHQLLLILAKMFQGCLKIGLQLCIKWHIGMLCYFVQV